MAILAFLVIFASGYLDHLMGARASACVTWFFGLVGFSFWIFTFVTVTIFALVLAPIVFAIGMIALVSYYRRQEFPAL